MLRDIAQRPVTGCGQIDHPIQYLRAFDHQRQIAGSRSHGEEHFERSFAGGVGQWGGRGVAHAGLDQLLETRAAGGGQRLHANAC